MRRSVLAVLTMVIVACVLAGVHSALASRRRGNPNGHLQIACANNLRHLGGIYSSLLMEKPGPPPYDGTALWLEYRKREYVQRTRESVMLCPGDESVFAPQTDDDARFWDDVDYSDAAVVRRLCSYAVREFTEFPLDPDSEEPQAIACDAPDADGVVRHHRGGLTILFDDGAAQWTDREHLGLQPDEPITIGPDARAEVLRALTVVPLRNRRPADSARSSVLDEIDALTAHRSPLAAPGGSQRSRAASCTGSSPSRSPAPSSPGADCGRGTLMLIPGDRCPDDGARRIFSTGALCRELSSQSVGSTRRRYLVLRGHDGA